MKSYNDDPTPDFTLEDHGTLCILNALTPEARHWVEGNIESGTHPCYPRMVAIEPRFVGPVCRGIDEDGLVMGGLK